MLLFPSNQLLNIDRFQRLTNGIDVLRPPFLTDSSLFTSSVVESCLCYLPCSHYVP